MQDNGRLTYSIPEAAARLGISRDLAYELAKRGELPGSIRLGKKRLVVSRVQLERFILGKMAGICTEHEPVAESKPKPENEKSITQSYVPTLSLQDTKKFDGQPVFYMVQVEPEVDPERIKFGFTEDLRRRVGSYRMTHPDAAVVKAWPCKAAWEGPAMQKIADGNCLHLNGELYQVSDLDATVKRGNEFFILMPDATRKSFRERMGVKC